MKRKTPKSGRFCAFLGVYVFGQADLNALHRIEFRLIHIHVGLQELHGGGKAAAQVIFGLPIGVGHQFAVVCKEALHFAFVGADALVVVLDVDGRAHHIGNKVHQVTDRDFILHANIGHGADEGIRFGNGVETRTGVAHIGEVARGVEVAELILVLPANTCVMMVGMTARALWRGP